MSDSQSDPIRIFVAGDRMSVGKSSVCLGILGALLRNEGYSADSLAYIKPATQNESPQPVQKFCEAHGIARVPIGPVVFYRGFTRAYLAGATETTESLLAKVSAAVDELASGKKVVVIDGVGFPAVGSICGTDNASVAAASGYPNSDGGRAPPAVIIVGGSGVGSAVDAFNLNSTYFEMRKIPVIGAIFNKLNPDESSFYSLKNCKEQISMYFTKNEHQRTMGRSPFGFVPLGNKMDVGDDDEDDDTMTHIDEFLATFAAHVDVPAIIEASKRVQNKSHPACAGNEAAIAPAVKRAIVETAQLTAAKTREEIEQAAISAGAAPSA